MDARTDRIIQVALELAERDGYDAVRLRDLAARAEVALGTVYRRFSCKEDILAAALEQQVKAMHQAVVSSPIPGDTAIERLDTFLRMATETLAERPKLAAAMLRTVASGVPELSEKVTRYYDRMAEIILLVYRSDGDDSYPTEDEVLFSRLLQNVWFGALVGWTGGLHEPEEVIRLTSRAARLLIAGLESS
jgi:AcrR family transcriptional regulator